MAIVSDVSDDQLRWAYAHCVALVAPALEDLGLTPLEVGAFGKPTLALRGGGYLDTVADGISGLFFDAADRRGHRRGGAAESGDRRGTPRPSCCTASSSARSGSASRLVAAAEDLLSA